MKKLSVFLFSAVLVLALLPSHATALTYNLKYVFSGDAPTGTPPWMQVNINNISGGVQLDLVNLLKSSSEFARQVYLSVNPALNPDLFTYAPLNPVALTSTINSGVDAFKADGDGYFDLRFSFPTAAGPNRFTMGETASYSILYPGLTESDFVFWIAPDGAGTCRDYAAAHIQGISDGVGGSGWIGTVPEPATLILLGSGLLAGLFRSRKKY